MDYLSECANKLSVTELEKGVQAALQAQIIPLFETLSEMKQRRNWPNCQFDDVVLRSPEQVDKEYASYQRQKMEVILPEIKYSILLELKVTCSFVKVGWDMPFLLDRVLYPMLEKGFIYTAKQRQVR